MLVALLPIFVADAKIIYGYNFVVMNNNEKKIVNDKNEFLVVNLVFFNCLKLQQKIQISSNSAKM